ncbi:MAG: CRTAC1 family protein [Verrucomicrobia bacterium]|nr:CRTAC1 family protein [Verrucomicrobiota bacterium]
MTRHRLATIAVATLAAGAGIVWVFQRLNYSESRGYTTTPPQAVRPPEAIATSGPEFLRRFEAFESERQRLDDTVWAKELLAQKHESVFVRLWDELRTNADAFEVLDRFAFGEPLVTTPREPASTNHGIVISKSGDAVDRLTRASWRELVGRWKRDGLRLEQSELRHGRFAISDDGTRLSVVAFALHAVAPARQERFVLRGELRVRWRKEPTTDGEPFPETIHATGLELLSRRGEAPFDHKVVADITPDQADPRLQEPSLHVYDLDGDGLSEIILPRLNRVYWNRGRGEFAQDELCAQPVPALNAWVLADFDGDGLVDVLGADAGGLALFTGDKSGHFVNAPRRIRFSAEPLPNPFVLTAGDMDGDGDLDVWLGQYKVPYQGGQMPTPYYDANDGWPSFLLQNDGHGNFADRTEQAGLAAKRFRRTYSSSFADLDDDGDLDLVVVSDFAGADIHLNDGRGQFAEATSRVLDEPRAFGMSHALADFDGDGRLDFFMIGMNSFAADRLDALGLGRNEFPDHQRMRSKMAYGNRLYFGRGGRFEQTPLSDQVARTGWSWGVTSGDFDNDGDVDLYVVNGHISGESVRDYESVFWRHDIYAGASRDDPALERYLRSMQGRYYGAGFSYGGYEKNRLFLNERGKAFLEAGYPMSVSLEDDCRTVVCDDLDGDGKLELLVTSLKVRPKMSQALHLFPNFTADAGNWIGVRLRASRPGFSPVGAKVILTTSAGQQIRFLVTGDSYRSQHAPTAHFGLGSETRVQSLEVIWPNGQRKKFVDPAVNRYHLVLPGDG